MTILVCGATGALGGAIARTLLNRGDTVRVLVRKESTYQSLADVGAEIAFGDLRDAESVAEAARGADVVVTTATAISRGGEDTIESVDRVGVRNLIDAARAAAVRHFVYTSILAAVPGYVTPIEASDQERADPHSDLRTARAATEQALAGSGLNYTVIAPHTFMELWLVGLIGARVAAGDPVTLIEPATARHGFVSRRDVAAFAVAAIGNESAYNRRVPVCGPQHLSWREVVQIFERVLRTRIDLRLIPPGRPIRGLPDYAAPLLAGLERVETISVDMEPLAREFGVTQTSVENFVRSTYGVAT